MSPVRIDSPANPRLKAAAALRERKGRDESGLMLVEGARELARALAAGVVARTLLVREGPLDPAETAWVEGFAARGAERLELSARAFAKLAYRDPPETGVLAVVALPARPLAGLEPRGPGPVLVLDGAEKPGNLGAVLRSADAAGAACVLTAGKGADWGNPNLLRASLGTLFALPVGGGTEDEVAAWLAARGIRTVAATPEAEAPYDREDLTGKLALVLGSEADGLTPGWKRRVDRRVAIPMGGVADSLNLAQAATVLLFEALRQRRAAGS